MKTLHSFFILICFVPVIVFSQGVGVGTNTPDPSAALEVTSVTQGILVPRMTTTQRAAISNPANGLLVFDLTTNSFWFKGGGQWIELIDTSNTVVHKTGSDIYMGMGGNVGIGTTTPTSKLEVKTSPGLPGIRHTDGVVTMQTKTTASAATINTTSNHSLQLNANNGTNHFTINPTGFVGINNASPQQQLHVNGNTFLQGLLGIGMASPEAPL
ncbi:MAG TPA: hypothetical protein VN763_06175, partial [Saprospiraceae bacterium]|nr:hypothetical protein [Saprospiraceae bacterium]